MAALSAGLLAGAVLGFVLAPRPPPPVPTVVLPPAATDQAPALVHAETTLRLLSPAGPLLMATSDRLDQVNLDGGGRRTVLDQPGRVAAAVPGRDGAPLLALAGTEVVAVEGAGGPAARGPAGFRAAGLAGDGRQALACGVRKGPDGRDRLAGLFLPAGGGPAKAVQAGCPVAWAARANVAAAAAAPAARLRGALRGTSVVTGPPGGPLRPLVDRARLEAASGPGAVVGALAVSPDGKLVAIAAGTPGGRWAVLVVPAGGGAGTRIPLAPGHEAAWVGWAHNDDHGARLAVAALDRRGALGQAALAGRAGGGYLLVWEPRSRSSSMPLGGAALSRADGFAWSPGGDALAVSSPRGLAVSKVGETAVTGSELGGVLLAWEAGG